MADADPNAARSRRRRRLPNLRGGKRKYHQVGLTPEQEMELQARAAQFGVTVPRLLVQSAFERSGPKLEPEQVLALEDELFQMRGYLRALSNNVNQIAKAANATGSVGRELEATLAALQRATERLDRATAQVYS